MEISFGNAQIVLLFTILFVVAGFLAPITFAAYAPADQYIEVNSFEAQNTTTADSSHLICFDRNVKEPNTGTVFTELYLVTGEDGHRVEVDAHTMERYFHEGDSTVQTRMELPPQLEPGEYRYLFVVEMDIAQGRVTREFSFTSDKFTVVESDTPQTTNTTTADFAC